MMTLKDITLAMEAKGLFDEVEQLREIRQCLEVEINNAHETIRKRNSLIKQLRLTNQVLHKDIDYLHKLKTYYEDKYDIQEIVEKQELDDIYDSTII